MQFYVYAHYDDAGRVFYIGKGTGNRAYKWNKGDRSVYWERHVHKYCQSKVPVVQIWAENLTEDDALVMEQEWITLYGRRDLGNGRLVNLTNGGDQPPSPKGRRTSEETRRRMSEVAKKRDLTAFLENNKGTRFRKGQTAHNKGKPSALKGIQRTKETKRKISLAQKGKAKPPHVKEMLRAQAKAANAAAMEKRRRKVRRIDDGTVFLSISEAARACGLYAANISAVCRGRLKSTKGYRFEYIKEEKEA